MKLSEVKPGSTVTIGNMQWDVLGEVERNVLCLSHKIVCNQSFDNAGCNNWGKSGLRKYLNGEFFCALKEDLQGEEPLLYSPDLMTSDGQMEYESSADKVFLLSLAQYRNYRQFISNANNWWLLTADSGCNNCVCIVSSDGSLTDDIARNVHNGVRPVCIFSPTIDVEMQEDVADQKIDKKLEKEGWLLRLPCYIGDPIYDIVLGRVVEYEVNGFSFGNVTDFSNECFENGVKNEVVIHFQSPDGNIVGKSPISEIGKTMFFTELEARHFSDVRPIS